MKRQAAALMAAVLTTVTVLTGGAAAEESTAVSPVSYSYDFSSYTGGIPEGFTTGNCSGTDTEGETWDVTYEAANGALCRKAGDISFKAIIPQNATASVNCNWPILTNNQLNAQLSGNIIHIGASIATATSNFSNLGIGGPVIYTLDSDETQTLKGTDSNSFANKTVIAFNSGKIYAWGTEVGTYTTEMFYRIDSYVDTATSCQTIYINGKKVLDNSKITATVESTADWKLRGMRGVRFNYGASTNATSRANEIYFDDAVFEMLAPGTAVNLPTVESKASNVTVDDKASSISYGEVITQGSALLEGISIPEGASAEVIDDKIRVEADGYTYFYTIKDTGAVSYNFNNQTGMFSSLVAYKSGLGGKDSTDYSMTNSGGSPNRADFEIDLADEEKLTFEANILVEDMSKIDANISYVFEPWFTSDEGTANVATNLFGICKDGITIRGKIITPAYSNRWYKLAAEFTGGSSEIQLYLNGKAAGTIDMGTNNKVRKFYRIKTTFNYEGIYLDDVKWYKTAFTGADSTAEITSDKYTVLNNMIILSSSAVVGEVKNNITGVGTYKVYTDSTYGREAADDDTVTTDMVIVVKAADNTTFNYYGFMTSNPGVRGAEFTDPDGNPVSGEIQTGTYELTATFEAAEDEVTDGGTVQYMMIIAGYTDKQLTGVKIKNIVLSEDAMFTTDYIDYTVAEGAAADTLKAFIWKANSLAPMIEAMTN